ncbi:acylphosphatase [Anoxybacillus flavithermus]|uniref:acylphosphatase n=1 Tax=Anoxybacillus flavithermus (strain DSM 21510 / WK1) TaxID=491915 RepID=B7GG13_ANOFW|nr:acylphosphatase [Anoxybacillus flavithermus]ACJ32692.1 Acylphosphatase [Anoxybacillus flavithermus WK1]
MIARYAIVVHGRVQSVGFRYFAQYEARRRGLTGWVKNCDAAHMIEMEVQGDVEKVEAFVDEIKKGPPFARVERIEQYSIPTVSHEKTFRIIY